MQTRSILETSKGKKFSILKNAVFNAEATTQFSVAFSCGIIQDLQHQFQKSFSDLDSIADKIRLFQNPFNADVAICPDILQLELIELQAQDLFKDKFKEGLVAFYQFLPKEQFPNSRNFASGFLSMFGTTYMCEQTFSKIKLIKSNLRTNLSDNHLKYLLVLETSGLKPDFPAIFASKKQFYHSYHSYQKICFTNRGFVFTAVSFKNLLQNKISCLWISLIYIYIDNNKSGKTVSKELNENSEH